MRTRKEQRKIRRAIGPAAEMALLDAESRAAEIDRFLLIRFSFWARLKFFVTGQF